MIALVWHWERLFQCYLFLLCVVAGLGLLGLLIWLWDKYEWSIPLTAFIVLTLLVLLLP